MILSEFGFQFHWILPLMIGMIVLAVEMIKDRWNQRKNADELKPLLPVLQALFCAVATLLYYFKVEYTVGPWSWLSFAADIVFLYLVFFLFTFGLYEYIVKKLEQYRGKPTPMSKRL